VSAFDDVLREVVRGWGEGFGAPPPMASRATERVFQIAADLALRDPFPPVPAPPGYDPLPALPPSPAYGATTTRALMNDLAAGYAAPRPWTPLDANWTPPPTPRAPAAARGLPPLVLPPEWAPGRSPREAAMYPAPVSIDYTPGRAPRPIYEGAPAPSGRPTYFTCGADGCRPWYPGG